jgi:hypothetical protein
MAKSQQVCMFLKSLYKIHVCHNTLLPVVPLISRALAPEDCFLWDLLIFLNFTRKWEIQRPGLILATIAHR